MPRAQFILGALLVVMLFVAAFFGVMAFFFMRNAVELREQLRVEQENNAKTQSALRDAVRDLIKANERVEELESR